MIRATYYNEFDKGAAAWLRELAKEGWIGDGTVDERSIHEVRAGDIPARAHFFAGVGGWEFALRLAGWPDDLPVWTGSCPCQPFSAAGKRKGVDDARHLWPEFRRLIAECRPPVVFGEQVASADGRLWLAGVRSDLEALGYAVGAADLCSAGVGAPNIRQRLYWVACADRRQRHGLPGGQGSERDGQAAGRLQGDGKPECGGPLGGLGNPRRKHDQFEPGRLLAAQGSGCGWGGHGLGGASAISSLGYWDAFDILPCLDGKARRIEPGTQCVVDGLPEGMDARWIESLCQIQEEINTHADATERSASEVLREMQETLHPQFLQWNTGRPIGLQAAAVLFAAVCQLQGKLGSVFNGPAPRGSEALQARLRILRQDRAPASPSPGREFPEQRAGEFANLVSKLSQEITPLSGEVAPNIRHGWPLAHGVPGRVGLLRGYGNAINPFVAAEFVAAFLDTIAAASSHASSLEGGAG